MSADLDLEEFELFLLLRRRKEVKQSAVCAHVKLNQARLSMWERGKLELPARVIAELWVTLAALSESDEEQYVA